MSSSQRSLIFEAGTDGSRVPLVLLHGSFGTEFDLLPLAARVAPGSARLAVRGTVALGKGYAFFRRHSDRRVDEAERLGGAGAIVTHRVLQVGHAISVEDEEVTREWLVSWAAEGFCERAG